MKKNIFFKLFMLISIFTLIIISLGMFINRTYLHKYYVHKNKVRLIEMSETIIEKYKKNNLDIRYLEKQEKMKSVWINIYKIRDGKLLIAGEIDKSYFAFKKSFNELEILKVLDGKMVYKIDNYEYDGEKFLIFARKLEDGKIVTLSTSLLSMVDAASIAKEFFIYVSLVSFFIGLLMIWGLSKMITKPIFELNSIAREMAKLNFNKRVKVKSDDEIGELAKSINYMSDELEKNIKNLNEANANLTEDIEKERRIDKMRKEFISSISHELKTPIAIIGGYAEGLKDNIGGDRESREYYTDVIMDEATKMAKLVGELLELSKLDNDNMEINIEKFNITNLLNELIKRYEYILHEKNISLKLNLEDIEINADVEMMELVLTNYISNAVNYVEENGELIIDLYGDGDFVKVGVYNSGSNIPDDKLSKIWDAFYRVDKSRNRKFGGTGLGLAIVKKVIEKHNGDYGVENIANGIKFWIKI